MKDTLVLKDGTIIQIEACASLTDIKVISDNKAAMVELWDKLTEDNLAKMVVKNGDGVMVGNYSGLSLVNETSTIQKDGTVLTSFNLREKTDVEKRIDMMEDDLRTMEASQQTQDEAIGDLGQAVSDLAEGGV